MKNILATLFLLIALPAYPATYYVDFNATDNTGDGLTTENAWKYCPGTVGETGTGWPTPVPVSSTIIFDGGDTWDKGIYISSVNFAQPSQESERITLTTDTQDITDRAVISISSGHAYGFDVKRDYITIEYFEITLSYAGGCQAFDLKDSDFTNVFYNYAHDIVNTSAQESYAIACSTCNDHEIAYNVFENAEEKIVEYYGTNARLSFHHNVLRFTSDWSFRIDHAMNYNQASTEGEIYNNLFIRNRSGGTVTDPSFGIKFDGDSGGCDGGTACPDDNDVYNNIFIGFNAAIGTLDAGRSNGQGNRIFNNTIYGNGNTDGGADAYGNEGIANCTFGGTSCHNNEFENNIIYQIEGNGTNVCMLGTMTGTSYTNNIFRNNYMYHESDNVRHSYNNTSWSTYTNAYMVTNVNDGNGNVWSGNIVGSSSPGFAGGSHTVSSLPSAWNATFTALDANGLSLLVSATELIDAGLTETEFSDDIAGTTRGASWDIGAYEYGPSSTITGIKISLRTEE